MTRGCSVAGLQRTVRTGERAVLHSFTCRAPRTAAAHSSSAAQSCEQTAVRTSTINQKKELRAARSQSSADAALLSSAYKPTQNLPLPKSQLPSSFIWSTSALKSSGKGRPPTPQSSCLTENIHFIRFYIWDSVQ